MSRKWWSIIVEFVLVVVSLYIHWLSRFDDGFYIVFLYLFFFISGFTFTFYATCVFIWVGFLCWRELLFCRRFLSFVRAVAVVALM